LLNLMDVIPPGADPLLAHLADHQLEHYIIQMIPHLDVFERMHPSFHEYYAYTASQKFMFFLDTRKANLMSIKKIAHSPVMVEMLQLKKLSSQLNELNTADVERQVRNLYLRCFPKSNYERCLFTISF
jgi:hypothetical protein